MPLDIISRTVEFYEGGLSTLSERLRKNWLQKLDAVDTPDDSLTNLTWLYDMHPVGLELDNTQKSSEFNTSTSVFLYNVSARKDATLKSSAGTQPFAGSLCDPQVRMDYRTKWTGKPPFSYATLICLAMRELGKPKVTLSDIYGWIMNNFAYYRHTDSSWQ
ncbi:fork head domain protein, partial [Opisthorchis viverrini]